MDTDEEDYVFYGTPIEREEDLISRKKKSLAEASGHLRTLVPWKQEVRDEEGRRRFHGAFTGGFSAGYYNTVGSKEGWAPQSFTSSRKNRAEFKQQSIFSFLDDDEKDELDGQSLGTSMQFDTFGVTAAELARKQAEKEQQQRPSAIPGPVPDEIVLPATDSIGVKLLLKMGWRHGHSIRESRPNSLYDARREARKAFLALSSDDATVGHDLESVMELPLDDDKQFSKSTPVYVINPKQDLHGLGFDPFKRAPEFREKKRSRLSVKGEPGGRKPLSIKDSLFGFKSENVAPGFGIGALEDLDAEDVDVYAGYDFEETYVQEDEDPVISNSNSNKKLVLKEKGALLGFKVASDSGYQLERFDPPVVPKDYFPHHKFPTPLTIDCKTTDPPTQDIPPPEDNTLKVLIEGVATLVARCGKLFEDLSREKNQSNPLFSFLNGGTGHDYYSRKLWEEQHKQNDRCKKQSDGRIFPKVEKMTAENRGKILGEKPLERSSTDPDSSANSADVVKLQVNLSDTFTKPSSFRDLSETVKPFRDDPEKQERYEQFLKEKYHGGLRSKDAGRASNMSEAARAREKLEFETTAEAIQKGKWGKESKLSDQHFMEMSATAGLQFTSGGLERAGQVEEVVMKDMYPKREEFQWRPSPILCKRFDIIDPYMGKPPAAPRVRSKMDSLIFTSDSVKPTKTEETIKSNWDSLPVTQYDEENTSNDVSQEEIKVEAEIVERPVDLYKAIFSDDDSDDEVENGSGNQLQLEEEVDPQKKIEAAANATLSRLVAGDFLESLGKELGLEVPPDLPPPYSENKARMMMPPPPPQPRPQEEDEAVNKDERMGKLSSSSSSTAVVSSVTTTTAAKDVSNSAEGGGLAKRDDGKMIRRKHGRNSSSSSSSSSEEDERSKRRHSSSKRRGHRHRHRHSSGSKDSSNEDDRYNSSRSKGRKKEEYSRESSSSSRRHRKHHKQHAKEENSPSREDAKRERRRR